MAGKFQLRLTVCPPNKLNKKIQSSGQSLAGDKFLYTHDVGDEEVCKVSMDILSFLQYTLFVYSD